MTRGFRLTALAALALVAALALFASSRDTVAVPNFEPGGFACFEIAETATQCDGDSSPGAITDIHGRFCIGWNQDCSVKDSPVTDSNFGAVVGFGNPAFTGPDSSPPVGTIVGRLTSEATLGILSNPCNTVIQVAFTLINASINISDTIDPRPVGEADVMEPLALDANGNGLPDGVDKYPAFLNEQFENKQPIQRLFGISFIQGSWIALNFVFFNPGESFELTNQDITLDETLGVPSVTILQDPTVPAAPGPISDFCAPLLSDNITLGQTMDNPCTPSAVEGSGCPGTDAIFENRGYPLFPCETGNKHDDDGDGKVNDGCPQKGANPESGAECDNDISDDLEDSDVNDGCPQVGDQSEGARATGGACSGTDEGGCIFRQNPATAGVYVSTTLTASQRDADGDGIENSLDVCALTPNPEWDPRSFTNDQDFDGLPDACDPDPNVGSGQSALTCPAGITGGDEDGDCFSNRADNCPLDSQLEFPNETPGDDNLPDLNDEDGDGLGDICDPNPNDPDTEGVPTFICMKFSLDVGGAQKSTATYDPNQSLDCATSQIVAVTPGPTLAPGETPGPAPTAVPGTGNGPGGVDDPPDTGIGSLSPTATNVSVWAIALAALGGIGILAGVRILRSRRVDRGD